MMSDTAKAKLARLRTMHRCYTRLRGCAIRRTDEQTTSRRCRRIVSSAGLPAVEGVCLVQICYAPSVIVEISGHGNGTPSD
jgi:hypothetical protein